MTTLTIHVRNDGLVFDLAGVTLDEGCPRLYHSGRQWWRVWYIGKDHARDAATALKNAPGPLLQDVHRRGVTDIKIVSSWPTGNGFVPSGLACGFYDAVKKLLAAPPDGTPSYQVSLHAVRNPLGRPYYPTGAVSTCFVHAVGPKVNLQNIPRGAGKSSALAAGYGANPQADLYRQAWTAMSAKTDYEKLEARVASLEKKVKLDLLDNSFDHATVSPHGWASPIASAVVKMPPVSAWPSPLPRAKVPGNFFWDPAERSWTARPTYFRSVFDESAKIKVEPKKLDYSKMVLRIYRGITGLCLPEDAAKLLCPAAGGVYDDYHGSVSKGSKGYDALAKKLRELKVRDLTLRRVYASVPMERMTEWLVAVVNASSPVMKITSDPEPLK